MRAPGSATASGEADDEPPFRGRPEFSDPQLVRTEWALPLSRRGLHGLADTLSSVIVAEPERVRGLHADLDQLIDGWPDPESLVLQQVCHTWIAVRRDLGTAAGQLQKRCTTGSKGLPRLVL